MPSPRRTIPALVAGLLLVAGMASVAVAADPLVVSGTVSRDGTPVAGASVTVVVAGSDAVMPATTDKAGAWTVSIDAMPGDTLDIGASTSSSTPAGDGCIRTRTASGHVSVAVDALPASVAVVLDNVRSSTVCAATASPGPVVTLPPTDAAGGAGARGSDTGVLGAVLVLLAGLALATALPAGRRRTRRPR
jgi:hypothetical protein